MNNDIGGIYRNNSDKIVVFDTAIHTQTNEELRLYKSFSDLESDSIWAMPVSEFDNAGFEKITEEELMRIYGELMSEGNFTGMLEDSCDCGQNTTCTCSQQLDVSPNNAPLD